MTGNYFRQLLADHWGKLLGGLIGLTVGLVFILFGFWRSLFIFLCVALGIYFGRLLDHNESLRGFLRYFWPDKD